MTQKQIQELSGLEGVAYVEKRNAFLRSAEPLPEYSAALTDHDARYRVQYMILHGWQTQSKLYNQIDAKLDEVDAGFLQQMAAGLSSVHNEYRRKTTTEWRRDVLPYAWEDILKFEKTKAQWKIDNSIFIIRAYPHEDSIDPLLLAMHLKSEREAASYAATLRDMPKDALEDRLEDHGRFYTFVEPQLRRALRGR